MISCSKRKILGFKPDVSLREALIETYNRFLESQQFSKELIRKQPFKGAVKNIRFLEIRLSFSVTL
jgi:hypothetical protein